MFGPSTIAAMDDQTCQQAVHVMEDRNRNFNAAKSRSRELRKMAEFAAQSA
jgi:hypothetical protein